MQQNCGGGGGGGVQQNCGGGGGGGVQQNCGGGGGILGKCNLSSSLASTADFVVVGAFCCQ